MGFFTEGELAKTAIRVVSAEDLKGECQKCGHWENSRHPNIEYTGQGFRKILVVSDYPTITDDVNGTYLRGEIGSILHNELRKHDINLFKDCWVTCAHRCLPKESVKDNLGKYIKFCQPYLHSIVMKLKPEYILLMGRWALTGFYHPHYSGNEGSYSPHRWRGIAIKDPKWNAVIFSTFHPREQVLNPKDRSHSVLFSRDIETFCSLVENKEHENIKQIDYEKYVSVLNDYPSVISLFNRIIDNKIPITFDYETTGLKPFSKGHKAVLVGIAVSPTEAYAVPLQYRNMWTKQEYAEIERLWKIILGSPDIKKNNHNILFEDVWSYGIFGTRLKGVEWDTQLGAHIIDNRRMYTGLKFQTYIHFGVLSYDEHIHKYLVSERKISEFNTVEKAPFRDLAVYCALDCIFSYRLMLIQKKFFSRPENWKQYKAFQFYKKGIGVMSELQINGIRSDVEYFTRSNEEVIKKIESLEQELLNGEEAKMFEAQVGRPMKLTATDMGKLLYEILQYDGEISKKGNYITDKNALSMIQSSFTDKYNELQKYRKINNSFFTNYIYYTSDDSRIHGSFTINHVVSYRSAATDPNMQNTSKRDKEAKTLLRTGFLPDPNSVIIEADFSGAEVNVSASTHGDKNFINYLLDPTTDMHRDCYSIDTQVLTENGFKLYHDIQDGEKIAQYNPTNGLIEYVLPLKRTSYIHNGDMYRFSSKHYDVLVTPNHRMYFRNKYHDSYEIIKAADTKRTIYFVKTGADVVRDIPKQDVFAFGPVYGIGHNSNKKYKDGFDVRADDMFELLGYLVTDGHFKRHKQVAYRINISQIKKESKAKIKSCIERIKRYTNFDIHEEINRDKWSMSHKSFCTWLCDNFGVNKVNRKLPDFIMYAPINRVRIFFDACILGDGSHISKNRINFFTPSKQMAEDFQFLCMRLGYGSYIEALPLKQGKSVQLYSVCISTKNEQRCSKQHKQIEKYNGEVFCFTVPSGLLVMKRNSKISIQGNSACDLFFLKPEEIHDDSFTHEQHALAKKIRAAVKGKWVFAQFYGDWYKSCGNNIWNDIQKEQYILPSGVPLLTHLAEKGINCKEEFIEHCEHAEHVLWYERFPEYTQWKHDIYEFYLKHGYIENFFGFRFQGYMDKKTATNYPIQSVSFQLLVNVLIDVSKFLKKERMRSKLIAQIHDSCVASVRLDEVDKYIKFFNETVCTLHERNKWMKVPMKAEFEVSKPAEQGGNFAKMYEIPESMLGTHIDLTKAYED